MGARKEEGGRGYREANSQSPFLAYRYTTVAKDSKDGERLKERRTCQRHKEGHTARLPFLRLSVKEALMMIPSAQRWSLAY